MRATSRRTVIAAALPMSGIRTVRPPRGGWHRTAPTGEGGDTSGGGGGGNNNGGGNTDTGKAGDDTDASKTPKIDGDFDADRAKATIAAARDAEKKARDAKKASDDRLTAVLGALGLTPDGKKAPEEQVKEIAAERDAALAKVREVNTRDAIRGAADKHGADAQVLLDSVSFLSKLTGLDATASDFGDKVAELVKTEVKNNPKAKKAGAAPGRSGGDFTGGGAGDRNNTEPKTPGERLRRGYAASNKT